MASTVKHGLGVVELVLAATCMDTKFAHHTVGSGARLLPCCFSQSFSESPRRAFSRLRKTRPLRPRTDTSTMYPSGKVLAAKSLCVAIVMINCNCCHRMHEHTLAAAHVCQCHQGSWWSHHVCTSLNLWGRHQTHQPARRSGWRTKHHTLPHAGGAKVLVSRLAPWTAQPQRKTTSSIVSGCSMLRAMARCAL